MNPIVYHIVSGQAFFTGVTLVLLATLLSLRESSQARR
ncbi:MAG TPA: acyl-CoA thioesterase, partial [Gimesia maris]|nr:acyl-CoA thioesterase [Gimesia maris]